jgi:uncharacterized protein YdaL
MDKKVPGRFNAAFEIPQFDLLDLSAEKYVVSWARHSRLSLETPYVLRNKNHWYIGDSPFSFITEEDRYLIMADLLFDILDEPPRWKEPKKPAVFRMEDVHPRVISWQLYKMTDLLAEHHVPFSMTLVPIFSDPLSTTLVRDKFVPMSASPSFIAWLQYAKKHNATFIFHGVSHQSGKRRNPWSGTTGDDFEFWDVVANKPLPWDSAPFVVNRLEDGLDLISSAQIIPSAWLSPHYQASPLDYVTFGELFTWNMGRIIYFPFLDIKQKRRLPDNLRMDLTGKSKNGHRLAYFEDLAVTHADTLPAGQFYPYEIYGDYYGQRVIPEDVGNVQPFMNEQVMKTASVEELIAVMKRNRVIRDAWGSYFVHPFQLDDTIHEGSALFPGKTTRIEKLIQATRDNGYEFIDLKSWIAKVGDEKRPEPIEYRLD